MNQNRWCGSLTTIAKRCTMGGGAGSVIANTTPACPAIDRYVAFSDRYEPGDDSWADFNSESTIDARYAWSSRTVLSEPVSMMTLVVNPSWTGPRRTAANVTPWNVSSSERVQADGIGTRNPAWFWYVRSGTSGIGRTVTLRSVLAGAPKEFVTASRTEYTPAAAYRCDTTVADPVSPSPKSQTHETMPPQLLDDPLPSKVSAWVTYKGSVGFTSKYAPGTGISTETWTDVAFVTPELSRTVRVTLYVPPDDHAWVTYLPDADVPSPK